MSAAPTYGSGRLAQGLGGAAVAGHPISALAGIAALEAGGNAVDACLAMAASDWAAMPDMCGPGGDLFALWTDANGTVHAVNGAGPAPAAYVHPTSDAERAGLCLIPGAPAAFEYLASNAGRLGRAASLKPAIALAARGVAVSARFDRQLQALRDGALRQAFAAAHGGALPKPGERFALPGLAESLADWSRNGPTPALGAACADWARQGASVTAQEASAFKVARETPLALTFGAWTIYGQPPMSQSVAALASLGIAGADTVRENDASHRTHMLIEAYKRAFSELDRVGDGHDPASHAAAMLAPANMRAKRESIGHRASQGPAMVRNYGETTQVAAVDASGGVCTLIHSLYRPFGGRCLASNGWLSNDRGASFSTGANAPAPGKRPRHTLVGILMRHPEDGIWACGTPGAQAQTQTNLQIAVGLMRDASDPAAAVAAPRWSFLGDDQIAVEAAMPTHTLDALAAAGHRLALRPPADWLMGSIGLAGFRGGLKIAVADHRREALALAF
ncbi:MAG: gamma-glutamyltransferase [Telmatospirillum sp.]|nr:gamma-glutamyltransferase [Telmatospirillum sp.]